MPQHGGQLAKVSHSHHIPKRKRSEHTCKIYSKVCDLVLPLPPPAPQDENFRESIEVGAFLRVESCQPSEKGWDIPYLIPPHEGREGDASTNPPARHRGPGEELRGWEAFRKGD